MTRRVLIVEDNPDIARLVQMHLGDIDCVAEICNNGISALERFTQTRHDLVVLDLMLPGLDGLSVCRRLRAQRTYVPILMLTAKSTELDRVLGLELGADDYLTKPFSIPELVARVKALFRRAEAMANKGSEENDACLVFGDMTIDVTRHQVSIGNREIALTAKEFELLLHFARHPGRVYSRGQLLDQVWGYGHDGYEHTVNSHINRLRSKIEADVANPHYVLTVWGVGYKFIENTA